MEPPRAWIRDTSVIESGRTCAVDPWMRCSNPSRIPITSQPEFTASMVAEEMTELIPGAGPPPHRMPILVFELAIGPLQRDRERDPGTVRHGRRGRTGLQPVPPTAFRHAGGEAQEWLDLLRCS